MSSQTHTFPCPFCGRRMGVGLDLLGKHVRCPHCKQVVLAPTNTGLPVVPPPASVPPPPPEPVFVAPPQPPAQTPPPEPDLPPEPVFNLPRESADSILSDADVSDDEVFGSQVATRAPLPVPELPPLEPLPPPEEYVPPTPPPASSDPFAFDVGPPPAPPRPNPAAPPPPSHVPTTALPNPFGEIEPRPALPPTAPPSRHPPAAPAPAPAAPSGFGNPWAGFDAAPAAPAPAPQPVNTVAYPAPAPRPVVVPEPLPEPEPIPAEEVHDEPPKKPARAGRARPVAVPSGGVPRAVLYVIGGYAVLVTLLAVYALFFRTPDLPPEHPLSTIPDNFGEFDPASRKGDRGKANANRFRGDGELPANLKAGLGGKIEVGQVEVQPLKVERRPLNLFADERAGDPQRMPSSGNALVLHLLVKNTSSDLTFCPLDPAFNRRTVTTDDRPLTRVVVGGETFYGGPINWPFRTARVYEEAQKDDPIPLKPGESREYVVCSGTDARLITAVRKATEPVLWRVQIRRGMTEYREKEVPVTAVIGVEFRASQVQ